MHNHPFGFYTKKSEAIAFKKHRELETGIRYKIVEASYKHFNADGSDYEQIDGYQVYFKQPITKFKRPWEKN